MSQIIPEQYMCYRAKEALTIDPATSLKPPMEARASAGSAVATRRLAWPESRE